MIMGELIASNEGVAQSAVSSISEVSIPKDNEKTNSKTPKYESSYVIINGQKIENEQEAIDLTKYSFRILSENVSKTVAQTEVLNSFTNDY